MAQTIDFNFPTWDQNVKNIYTNKTLHTLNETSLTRPLAEYGIGVGYVFRRVAGGNGAYFLGEVSSTAFPAYFPTVFLIKETIPFLSLILFTLAFTLYQIIKNIQWNKNFWKVGKHNVLHFLRSDLFHYSIFGFIVLYVYLSVTGNLNIGLRHLFPIFPFMFILVAKKISDFVKSQPSKTAPISKIIFLMITLWLVAETLISYPYYMSYFNQSVGGPKNGYNYVTDSNADWGQDMKRLRNWIDGQNKMAGTKPCFFAYPKEACEKPIDKIRVDYFGGSDILRYIGKDRAILWWDSKRPIEPGWYAISVNFRQGSIYSEEKTADDSYRWTLDYKPVAQVGTSILIYYIPE